MISLSNAWLNQVNQVYSLQDFLVALILMHRVGKNMQNYSFLLHHEIIFFKQSMLVVSWFSKQPLGRPALNSSFEKSSDYPTDYIGKHFLLS